MSCQSVSLKPTSFLISQLANDLAPEKRNFPELFVPCDIYEEDPGMNYEFRVEHELSKYVKKKDPELDQKLYQTMYESRLNKKRTPLPIDKKERDILESVRDHQATMIIGGTGSGKSTRVPQMILAEEIRALRGSECNIICTQPRRVAATSIAKRVAYELGEQVGQSVGYAIRGDSVKCDRKGGTIFYCTTGVLIRRLIDNPALVGLSHVILDEIHEDAIDLDSVIYFLRKLIKIRPDFKLVLMSATMDGRVYQGYFPNCPIIEVQGTNYEVKKYYLEDMGLFVGSTIGVGDMQSDAKFFVICKLVEYIVKTQPHGAILIFVPGWQDMEKTNNALLDYNYKQTQPEHTIKIRLLYSRVALEDRKIFDPIKGKGRKVLISTTIAESSITVPDVVYVIDTGTHIMPFFDHRHGARCFKTEFITKASAEQRLGRAGRVQPGICFRLYTKSQFAQFSEFRGANKSSQNVGSAILNVLSLGETTEAFKSFVHPPDRVEVAHELNLLRTYNMIGANDRLTFLGIRVNHMSADPLIAKFAILSSLFGCVDQAAVIISGLSIATLFPMPQGHKTTKKMNKKHRNTKPPQRSELTIGLTGTRTSDGLAILGTLEKYAEAIDKKGFCLTHYLFEKSLGDVLVLSDVVKQEVATLKGVPQRKMANSCFESILAAAFMPNLAYTMYTSKTRSNKFYTKDSKGFANAQLDSVLARKDVKAGELYTFSYSSGIPPKINLSFLNKISPEALFLFGEKVDKIPNTNTKVLVNDIIMIEGDESKIEFLHNLRSGFLNVFSNALKAPKSVDWNSDASGRILDIIIRLLSE